MDTSDTSFAVDGDNRLASYARSGVPFGGPEGVVSVAGGGGQPTAPGVLDGLSARIGGAIAGKTGPNTATTWMVAAQNPTAMVKLVNLVLADKTTITFTALTPSGGTDGR